MGHNANTEPVCQAVERAMIGRVLIKLLFAATLLGVTSICHAADVPLTFGVVPQQAVSKLARQWGPLLQYLSEGLGRPILFRTAPDIPTFEQRLADGEYDLAYMNPYHYTVFSKKPGYMAFAHASKKRIQGIIVTRGNAPQREIQELSGMTLTFPSAAAFAASMLTQQAFKQQGIPIKVKYVSSHDSVYRTVEKGLYPAGGGVMRTFNSLEKTIRDRLRILWKTPGYTPHAVAAHPRVSLEDIKMIQDRIVKMSGDKRGAELLKSMSIQGWQTADDQDWNDVRGLDLKLLDHLIEK